jgi:hypothetical protein
VADDDEGGDGGQAGEGGGPAADGDAGGVDRAELRQAIREVLAELGVGAAGAGGGGEGDEGGDGAPGDAPAAGGRLIDQEAWWESRVRKELDMLKAKEGIDELKEEVRKIVERPPKKYRRITQFMYGTDD